MPAEVLFVGVEGKDFKSVGAPLSPEVERVFPMVVAELEKLVASRSGFGREHTNEALNNPVVQHD